MIKFCQCIKDTGYSLQFVPLKQVYTSMPCEHIIESQNIFCLKMVKDIWKPGGSY